MILPKASRVLLFIAAFALADLLFADDPVLPDLKITPGVYRKNLSQDQICHTKWGLDKRHVTLSMKKQVFAEYGIPYSRHSEFEVDHLISRELGSLSLFIVPPLLTLSIRRRLTVICERLFKFCAGLRRQMEGHQICLAMLFETHDYTGGFKEW